MKRIACLLVTATVLAVPAAAQTKPEDAIKLRRASLALMGYNFGSIGAMVQDKKPYNKDEAAKNAFYLDMLAKLPADFFTPGSDKGDTKAKPELWQNLPKVKSGFEQLSVETAKLAEVAKSGDKPALKAQFGETAKVCKACHDDYRAK